MTWPRRILVGLSGLLLSGCVSGGLANLDGDGPAALARAQLPDSSAPLPKTDPSAKPTMSLPSAPAAQSNLLPPVSPLAPASAPVTIQQATALLDGSKVRVRVRAWVNGRPIFEEELIESVKPHLFGLERLPEPQRSEKIAEIMNIRLEQMIDQEVMYQDAVKKLEKFNPKALGKLREEVDQDFDKRMKKLRDAGMPEPQIKEFGHVFRRMLERDTIAQQYATSMISGPVKSQVTLEKIKDYYDQHPEEFTVKDRVEWQDVFIAVGAKHPTLADARRFAEQLLARCERPEDFATLQAYDEGESKTRGGAGFGQRQGEIQPAALEPYLFALKEGQIGPVVDIGTGVHIFRVTKREYAGPQPMTDKVQEKIRRTLQNKIVEREYQQLTRVMRARAVVQIVRDLP